MKRLALAIILITLGALLCYGVRALAAWTITRAAMLHLYLNGHSVGEVGDLLKARL